ncbi:MAG TPA: DoxX family protein [Kofleriaceae bacterium]|nr:DoxX family protein [Kofleriaceae bacterium]
MTNRKIIIIGTVLAGLTALFLGFDVVMKLVDIAPARDGMANVGFSTDLARILGAVVLACFALYVDVRKAVPAPATSRLTCASATRRSSTCSHRGTWA